MRRSAKKCENWGTVPASIAANQTSNPIRTIVDRMTVPPNPAKETISLAIGDPTLHGNFKCPDVALTALQEAMHSYKFNGYTASFGYDFARDAIAKSHTMESAPVTANDVVICSGASGAVEIAISVLANPGQNILLPRPGFSLYRTICDSKGIEVRFYDLLPNSGWEMDLDMIRKNCDDNTACILINNPSNPCGCNYSEEHLTNFVALCDELKLPVISDEIYEHIVFDGGKFTSLASISKTVPILTIGGIAKRYLVPGWRIGWIIVHDRQNSFGPEVRYGITKLTQLILGANTLCQAILPKLLLETPASFHDEVNRKLKELAEFTCERLTKVPGLKVIVPSAAMYVMTGIDISQMKDIKDDTDFCAKLVGEESIICLPGSAFEMPNYFRIVFTSPREVLAVAYDRMEEFCKRHHV